MSGLLDAAARDALVAAAVEAARGAYAPYSKFHVGAALLLSDGRMVTGANVENASYGLSLCAETVAVAQILSGTRAALVAVAVVGGPAGENGAPDITEAVTPCGRCRQVLTEIAHLGGTDPLVICAGSTETVELSLSALLPRAFGPANLA